MSLAGTSAITELWAKCKAWFGNKLANTQDASTVTVQLKNNGDDVLSSTTIPTATPADGSNPHAGVMSAADKKKLDGIATGANAYTHPTTTAVAAAAKKVGNDANGHVVLGAALTASDVGAAASSHAHGNITSGGDITASAPTIASGDKLIINDESASKVTNGPSFGTDTTKYLRNDGSWAAPAGTSYSDFTGATSSTAGTNGLVPAPSTSEVGYILGAEGSWENPVSALVNAIGLTSSEEGDLIIYSEEGGFPNLESIPSSAFENQNAFSNVKVGSTTVVADSETDTLELVGSNVTLTPDATNDKVTIGITASNVTTALGTTAVARASANASGTAFGAAAVKGVDTSISSGSTSTNLPTSAAVASLVSSIVAGATQFQGTVSANSTISGSSYVAGMYWVVATAGTYVGQTCEVGDMVFAIANKGSSYSASDFSVVQNNIVEMTAAEVDAICV